MVLAPAEALDQGVSEADLEGDDLAYRRARDKSDKSLELYKFQVNALYVAMTRAVETLMLVEQHRRPVGQHADRIGAGLQRQQRLADLLAAEEPLPAAHLERDAGLGQRLRDRRADCRHEDAAPERRADGREVQVDVVVPRHEEQPILRQSQPFQQLCQKCSDGRVFIRLAPVPQIAGEADQIDGPLLAQGREVLLPRRPEHPAPPPRLGLPRAALVEIGEVEDADGNGHG